jgi:predicted translin family RNA/ssDNA-binding protein
MIGRASLETVTAATERAASAARAVAAELNGLHSELDQFIEVVFEATTWAVEHVETAVLTEMSRHRSEEIMRALKDRRSCAP